MYLKLIDQVISSYAGELSDNDNARLRFFRGLWEVMSQWEDMPGAAINSYTAPPKEEIENLWNTDTAIFSVQAPQLSVTRTVSICNAIRTYVSESGVLADEDATELAGVEFNSFITRQLLSDAAQNPSDVLSQVIDTLEQQGVRKPVITTVCLIVVCALRVDFEPIAKKLLALAPKDQASSHHPINCPVCGSSAAIARVGGGDSPTKGRGRTLYCQQCGSSWAFERIRCARCGTVNQGHLHYFNVEGDDAHRIATCDECGDYIRTVFVEEGLRPFSYEVEEVLTAKLDAIAQDPQFNSTN